MKKVFYTINILVILFFLSNTLQAQVGAGTKSVGGSIGISAYTQKVNDIKINSSGVNINPGFDYFILDRVAVGVNLSYGISKYKQGENMVDYANSLFAIGPYGRYYFPLVEEKFYAYGEAGFQLIFGKVKDLIRSNSNNYSSYSLYASPGLAYFISENLSMELGFNLFNFNINNPEGEGNATTNFSLGFDSFSPNLGFRYFF